MYVSSVFDPNTVSARVSAWVLDSQSTRLLVEGAGLRFLSEPEDVFTDMGRYAGAQTTRCRQTV
jgi:hypothetical protein